VSPSHTDRSSTFRVTTVANIYYREVWVSFIGVATTDAVPTEKGIKQN